MIAEGHFNGDIILAALVAVTLYIYLAALFEHRKSSFVHETGVAIVIGFIMGLFGYFLLRDFFLKMVRMLLVVAGTRRSDHLLYVVATNVVCRWVQPQKASILSKPVLH